jgi:hypothetical protein
MIRLSACTSHVSSCCAEETNGKTAAKKINGAMADNFLIRRGQLNRMNRDCQADLISS